MSSRFANPSQPTITILGCGYVGVTTAVILANCGFNVYALEPMPERLKILKRGRSFFYEDGVDPLIAGGLKAGSLTFTHSYEQAVPESSAIFSCVGTPDNADGSSNLTYVFAAAEQAGLLMKPDALFVQKSTVPVGTGAKLEQLFKVLKKPLRYVSNPEFLREGSAIADTLWFDRVVAGSNDLEAAQKVLDVYKKIEENRGRVANIAKVNAPKQVPVAQYIYTSLSSAELIKVSANAFLALKISFANSIAKLADSAGADVSEVMDAVGADRRIGRAFLNAGRGYGGGCFPKDVSGLIRSAEEYGVELEIMHAATGVNESMPHYILNKAKIALGGSPEDNNLKGKKVAVLGLSFKAGTSDVRRSPAIAIANTLAEDGARVSAYDPESMSEARPLLNKSVVLGKSLAATLADAEIVFLATEWPEFIEADFGKAAPSAKLFVDCMNCLDKTSLPKAVRYIGVGRD